MVLVTLQLGQAGNQLGHQLFEALSAELRSEQGEGLSPAAASFFYQAQVGGETRLTARAVLLDMEPKVVQAALRAGRGRWHYSRALGTLTRQSGSGNCWALGYAQHGPAVCEQALGMVRKQVESCDQFGGFLLLQSLAGGTGSGLGTYLTEQLREEYPASRMFNHTIWPFEAGEVAVQPYNSLLSLAHLSSASDGLVLVENDALSATCQKLLGLQRPSFADMNAVAARDLAAVLLPSTVRPAEGANSGSIAGNDGRVGRGGAAASGRGRGRGSGGGGSQRAGRPAWDSSVGDGGGRASGGSIGGAWDGTFDTGSRWGDDSSSSSASGARRGLASAGGARPGQLRVLGDIVEQLCSHPSYRLLTLRSVPQMPAGSIDFTSFTWPALLKRLKQMLITGRTVDAGLDWSAAASSRPSAHSSASTRANKSLSSLLVLRGVGAREADASPFLDPLLSPSWQTDPLLVAASPQRLMRLDMCATLLSNCQTPLGPLGRMLGKACRLYDARAYVHHYNRHGLECADFEGAFEAVEDIVAKYQAL